MHLTIYHDGKQLCAAASSGDLPVPLSGAVTDGLVLLTTSAVAYLRRLLAIEPATDRADGLTDEQLQCARLRGELEKARKGGVLEEYGTTCGSHRSCEWCAWVTTDNGGMAFPGCYGPTELSALQATCEKVRTLRQPAQETVPEAAPDVEGMSADACDAELKCRGWQWVGLGESFGYVRGERFIACQYGADSDNSFRAAVTSAREIDEQAAPQDATERDVPAEMELLIGSALTNCWSCPVENCDAIPSEKCRKRLLKWLTEQTDKPAAQ